MNKIVFTAAALLLTSGMASAAGSDHYGSDYNYTSGNGSIVFTPSAKPDYAYPMLITGATAGTPAPQDNSSFDIQAPGYGQGLWGSR